MAAAQGEGVAHLRLERRRANLLFSSWRLSSSIAREQGGLVLPARAAPPTAANTDYVTARHAALLNALTQQSRGCYTFLEEGPAGGEVLALHQLELGEPGAAPTLHRVCGLPAAQHDALPGGLTAGSLPPSVVEVQTTSSPNNSHGSLLLVSNGRGDVSLAVRPAAGHSKQPAGAVLSAPVQPLRPPPPLQGVRPVHLAAAYVLPQQPAPTAAGGASSSSVYDDSGQQQQQAGGPLQLCCILWAGRPRSERQPSRCEVYAVHLAAAPATPEPALQVLGVQLLKVSDLPPHGVLVNPATGGVLLALQPSAASAEEEAAAQRAAAPSAAAAASGNDDMEGDDVSPRSLAAAVARLAAYTSEEPVGPLPHQHYADLYREAGSDGVGAMGSEPTCTLFAFALAASTAGAAGAAGAAQQGQQPMLRLVHTLSCQPHKLLTCHLQPPAFGAQEPPTPDTHLPEGSRGSAGGAAGAAGQQQQGSSAASSGTTLLLGLTDDVDCAVVAVSCCTGSNSGSDSSGGSSGQEGAAAAGFVVQHVSSIPAMAYVAAGKVQRKFLLLAPPGGDICAALVEASKYCYLYRSTAPRQEYGEHQVVDMELPDAGGRGVLGAALAGNRAGSCRLVAANSSSSSVQPGLSDLLTFEEVQTIARERGLEISVKTLGPFYRIVCRDAVERQPDVRRASSLERAAAEAGEGVGGSGRVLAVTSGFLVPPPLGLMHCDTLQVFTRGQRGEEGARTRGGALGLGLLMGAATFSFGAAAGCRKAEILAINDDDAWHDRLVTYYLRFGFVPVRVVTGDSMADLPHMLVWGGAGTRLDADVLGMLRRWTPAVRRNSAARRAAQATAAPAAGAAQAAPAAAAPAAATGDEGR
ncbi:hypothetical protein ABPG75_010467 [Micractinium tetrahymenae]